VCRYTTLWNVKCLKSNKFRSTDGWLIGLQRFHCSISSCSGVTPLKCSHWLLPFVLEHSTGPLVLRKPVLRVYESFYWLVSLDSHLLLVHLTFGIVCQTTEWSKNAQSSMHRHFATGCSRITPFSPNAQKLTSNTKSGRILNIVIKYSLFGSWSEEI